MVSFPVLLESFTRFHQSKALAGLNSRQLTWMTEHLWPSLSKFLEQDQDEGSSVFYRHHHFITTWSSCQCRSLANINQYSPGAYSPGASGYCQKHGKYQYLLPAHSLVTIFLILQREKSLGMLCDTSPQGQWSFFALFYPVVQTYKMKNSGVLLFWMA